jgi:hypothetical protein
MTALDNLEFPWQPEDPIPWEARSFDFTAHTPERFITADVTRYEYGPDAPKPWKVYASVYDYKAGRGHRHQDWHATADDAKAAAEAHIREHTS